MSRLAVHPTCHPCGILDATSSRRPTIPTPLCSIHSSLLAWFMAEGAIFKPVIGASHEPAFWRQYCCCFEFSFVCFFIYNHHTRLEGTSSFFNLPPRMLLMQQRCRRPEERDAPGANSRQGARARREGDGCSRCLHLSNLLSFRISACFSCLPGQAACHGAHMELCCYWFFQIQVPLLAPRTQSGTSHRTHHLRLRQPR